MGDSGPEYQQENPDDRVGVLLTSPRGDAKITQWHHRMAHRRAATNDVALGSEDHERSNLVFSERQHRTSELIETSRSGLP
jgi:hypothetical protein